MTTTDPAADATSRPAPRAADVVFALCVVAAVPLYLVLRLPAWFGIDDWDPLTERALGSWSDLVRPHFDHFSMLPIVVYRLLLPLVGLDSRPYQLITIVLHLVVAVLLRALVLRAGVDRWIATAAALVLVFFALGNQNITYAFGMSFTAVLALGLGQLLLTDHDGGWDRRDTVAAVLGLLAITSSGVAVPVLATVAAAVWARRGIRVAAGTVAPAAVTYLVWTLTVGRPEGGFATASTTWRFVHEHAWGLVRSLGGTALLAPLWVGLLLVGLVTVVQALRRDGRRSRLTTVGVLATGALLYVVATGVASRPVSVFPLVWPAPRHLHVMAVLLLPMLAVGADRLAAGRPPVRSALVVLMLVGLPLGFRQLHEERTSVEAAYASNPRLILGAAQLSFTDELPDDLEPDPVFHPGVTIGWLRDLHGRGLLPAPPPTSPVERAGIAAVVALRTDTIDGSDVVDCETADPEVQRTLASGDRLVILNAPVEVRVVYEGVASVPSRVEAAPYVPGVRTAMAGPLTVVVTSADPDEPASVCTLR